MPVSLLETEGWEPPKRERVVMPVTICGSEGPHETGSIDEGLACK